MGALGDIHGVGVASKAESPTGLLRPALIRAFLKEVGTSGILFTDSPFTGALLLDARQRVSYGHGGLDLVEAIVVENALPEGASRSVSFLGDAISPASLVIVTLSFTILKGSQTSWILATGMSLIRAVFLDAVLRSEKGESSFSFPDIFEVFDGIEAVVVAGTFHEIGGVLFL